MPVAVGDRAPNFELFDQDANEVSRASLEGRKSLVVFIPFPFSGICEAELCSIRDNLARLNGMDANVVAITCDARASFTRNGRPSRGSSFRSFPTSGPTGRPLALTEASTKEKGSPTG